MDGHVCETARALLRFAPQWGGKKVGVGAWERHYFIAVMGSKPVKTREDQTQAKREILNFMSFFFFLSFNKAIHEHSFQKSNALPGSGANRSPLSTGYHLTLLDKGNNSRFSRLFISTFLNNLPPLKYLDCFHFSRGLHTVEEYVGNPLVVFKSTVEGYIFPYPLRELI